MKYRAEIDGLRALAVVPVVLYHAKVPIVTGGFVGVDIFFVISGFLISSILLREIESSRFSILGFYERRIRRIFPALFAVIFASIVAGYFLEFPSGYKGLAESAAAAALFGSNMYFWRTFDYFNSNVEAMPLIHTWSLAIEEQFYIFFPLILALLCRYARTWLRPTLIAVAVLSFGLATVEAHTRPMAAFYLLPTRAWELMAGALLATGTIPEVRHRWQRNSLGLIGFASFFWSILALDSASVFPGLNALPAVAAAVALILAGKDSWSGRVLTAAPLVGVGIISYSLYLWHWPIIVFNAILTGGATSATGTLSLLMFILVVSALSWRFIEMPFRRRPVLTRTWVFGSASAAICIAVVIGVGIATAGGIVRTYPTGIQHIISFDKYDKSLAQVRQFDEGICFNADISQFPRGFDPARCLTIDQHRTNVLLLGDSHAAQLSSALRKTFPAVHLLQATQPWCTPVFMPRGSRFAQNCPDILKYVFSDALANRRLDLVIMAARWSPDDIKRIGPAIRYVRRFTPRVVVLGPIQEYAQPLPVLLANSVIHGNPEIVERAQSAAPWTTDLGMTRAVRSNGATYISVLRTLCPDHVCVVTSDGDPLQFDYGHLTSAGATLLVQRVKLEMMPIPLASYNKAEERVKMPRTLSAGPLKQRSKRFPLRTN